VGKETEESPWAVTCSPCKAAIRTECVALLYLHIMVPKTVLSIVSFVHRNNGMYHSTWKSYLQKLLDSIVLIWQSWE